MLPHHVLLHAKSLPTLRAPPKPEAGFRPLPSQVYTLFPARGQGGRPLESEASSLCQLLVWTQDGSRFFKEAPRRPSHQ